MRRNISFSSLTTTTTAADVTDSTMKEQVASYIAVYDFIDRA
jgi:hypothetical protein